MNKEINIIMDEEGRKIVVINDIRFKGKMVKEWGEIEKFLYEYVGKFYEIEETAEKNIHRKRVSGRICPWERQNGVKRFQSKSKG